MSFFTEQEQDAEQERHRREQELKRKRDATTLEDIKDQLSKLEARLKELKEEKHELFLQLKKVLNEDEIRKRQKESEIMAAHQALQAQQQINLQNALNFYSNSSLYQKPQTQAPQQLQQPAPHLVPTSQPMSAVQISQSSVVNAAQQLYAKLSPMPVSVSLASSINNSVITQSAAMSGQAQLNPSKRACSKRVHERSPSPQPAIPYTGILPIYKTTLAFTPTLARKFILIQHLNLQFGVFIF